MKNVCVDRLELMEKIEVNRKAHRAIFEEAVEGYRKRAVEILEEHIERIKEGKIERVYVSLPVPEDHTSDYDRVIEMLGMHQAEDIEIDENHFASYVLDDWSWKNEFLASSAPYSATAAAILT